MKLNILLIQLKKIFIVLLISLLVNLFFLSCSSINKSVCDLTPPPSIYIIKNIKTKKDLLKNYNIIKNIKTKKDLLKNYKNATIKISHWQNWYNIQVGSNYFSYSNSN